jgi:hypothetical protein
MFMDLELLADLDAQDDDGFGWSTLADASAPGTARPGAMLLAGNSQAQSVVRVVAVDDDGQNHFAILPGSVAKNRHLLDLELTRFVGHPILGVVPGEGGPDGSSSEVPRGVPA